MRTSNRLAAKPELSEIFIRADETVENGLALWVVSDNLRKGAALNAVQIAETLIQTYMRKAA